MRLSPLLTVAVIAAFGQTPGEPDANVGCIERLQIPSYAPLAEQAQIQGTITATIIVSPSGSSQEITTAYAGSFEKAKAILSQSVESAVRSAKFRQKCAAKQVTLVFHFELVERPSQPRQSVSFSAPNEFWITSWPPVLQIVPSIKAGNHK